MCSCTNLFGFITQCSNLKSIILSSLFLFSFGFWQIFHDYHFVIIILKYRLELFKSSGPQMLLSIFITKMQVKESKWLVKCFLNYLRHDKTEVNVLFDILSIFLFHSRIDYTFLKEFYIIEVQ